MRRCLKGLIGLTVVLLASAPLAAQARVFVGVGIGVQLYAPFYGPPPAYYYPPPAVYSPPVVYAPPPVVYTAPAVTPVAAPPPQTGNCREYRGDAIIDGKSQPFYGTACLRPDGRWHIVN